MLTELSLLKDGILNQNPVERFQPPYGVGISGVAAFPFGERLCLGDLPLFAESENLQGRQRAGFDSFYWLKQQGQGHNESEQEFWHRLGTEQAHKAVLLAKEVCQTAHITPSEVDHLVLGTTGGWTGLAEAVCREGNFCNAQRFHIGASCPTGSLFWYYLYEANKGFGRIPGMRQGMFDNKRIMLLAPEIFTTLIDDNDINKTLFGDVSAGAAFFYGKDQDVEVLNAGYQYRADTERILKLRPLYETSGEAGNDYIITPNGIWAPVPFPDQDDQYFSMDGKKVFRFVSTVVPLAVESFIAKAEIVVENIDLLICHQANKVLIDLVNKKLHKFGLPRAEFVNGNLGNNSAASIFTALFKSLEGLPKLNTEQQEALGVGDIGFSTEQIWGMAQQVGESGLAENIQQELLKKFTSLQKEFLEVLTVSFGAGLAVSYAHLRIRNPYYRAVST